MHEDRSKRKPVNVHVEEATERYNRQLDGKLRKSMAHSEEVTKKDEDTEQNVIPEPKVPITSKEIAETVKKLEKRIQQSSKDHTFIKYNTLDAEQTKAWTKEICHVENMTDEEDCDEWICANEKQLAL